MKMTDESVAKALGWKSQRQRTVLRWWKPGEDQSFDASYGLPRFTTSLDAIVAEIEARGLQWEAHNTMIGKGQAWAAVAKEGYWDDTKTKDIEADTAPLALCAALLAYLKEKP